MLATVTFIPCLLFDGKKKKSYEHIAEERECFPRSQGKLNLWGQGDQSQCGIQKNVIDDFICKAEIETQTQRTNQEGKRGWDELGDWDRHIYTIDEKKDY